MGLIFDKKTEKLYKSWYRSSQGRAIDNSIEQLFLTLLHPKPGERILDIGCGTGNHLIAFNRLGLNVSGIDASPHMIREAEKRLGRRCTLRPGSAESLPFDDNEFDLAVFINSFEFMDNPLQALREAGRVANKKVFIGVINSFSWGGLLRRVQGSLGDPLFNHAKFYNIWQMKSLLKKAYGTVPVSWGSIRLNPSFAGDPGFSGKKFLSYKHSPFGFFLGFSATMVYRIKTDNLPLQIKLKKASQPSSVVRAEPVKRVPKECNADERSLSV